MVKEGEVSVRWPGQNGKRALELEEDGRSVYDFLKRLKISPSEIVTMSEIWTGHNRVSKVWIGTRIGVDEISKESIREVGGTGCLEVTDDQNRETIFIKGGEVVLESKEAKKPEFTEPRRSKMNLNL